MTNENRQLYLKGDKFASLSMHLPRQALNRMVQGKFGGCISSPGMVCLQDGFGTVFYLYRSNGKEAGILSQPPFVTYIVYIRLILQVKPSGRVR